MSGSITPALPPLPTLDGPPSWANRAGRVDRSACAELRASELWRLATFTPAPRRFHPHGESYCEAIATIGLSARWLAQLHSTRNPIELAGDRRTSKAAVMKALGTGPATRPGGQAPDLRHLALGGCGKEGPTSRDREVEDSPRRGAPACRPTPRPPDERYPFDAAAQRRAYEKYQGSFVKDHPYPASNPNKGASRTKQIGLWGEWGQEIVVERWFLHERLSQHFLRCPGGLGDKGYAISDKGLAPPRRVQSNISDKGGDSDAVAGRRPAPAYGLSLIPYPCLGKALKLFMVLCTPAEAADAEFAEAWIRHTDARHAAAACPMPPEVLALRDRLIRRYGVLFRGRRLLCRGCLGIRYGEVKKSNQPRERRFDSPPSHGEA